MRDAFPVGMTTRLEIWFYDRGILDVIGHPDGSTTDGVLSIIECEASALTDPDGWVVDVLGLPMHQNCIVCVRLARS